jgi:hypothetical protein
MKSRLRPFLFLLFLLAARNAGAQGIGPKPFEDRPDTTRKPKAVLGEDKNSGNMQVTYNEENNSSSKFETDSTGDTWLRYSDSGVASSRRVYRGLIHSGKGFRVQIYSGNDRKKAIQAKAIFMQRYPRIRTYLSYTAPQFRVKVGNFKSREEASGLRKMLSSLFNPVMIVPDVIVVNTMKQ